LVVSPLTADAEAFGILKLKEDRSTKSTSIDAKLVFITLAIIM